MTQAASLVVPALLLSIAAVLALAPTLPDSLIAAVQMAPLAVFGGGALLGLLIRRARLVLGLVFLALADQALVRVGGRAVFDAVALLLPLNLGLIAWLGEASLFTARGASGLGVTLLQAGGVVAVLQRPELAALAGWLERPLVATNLRTWTHLPQLALAAFAAALGLLLIRFFVNGRPLAAGTPWALAASFLALDGASSGRPASVYFVTAGLLLLVGAAWKPRIAHLDEATGLPSTFALNMALRRLPRRYALACVEIDDFKTFREEQGADAARRTLRLVAKALTKVGGGGRAFSLGAHTFAVLFRRTSAKAAAHHLDVVRRAVERTTLDVRVPEKPRAGRPARVGAVERTVAVTISVGVAQAEARGADPHEVRRTAEQALGRAKQAGENRVSA